MPIIHFINSKTQTAGGMKKVLAYVTRTEKTQSEDKQYVTALNCSKETAYEEMLATKNAYHKNSGRMYYHLVQSFPKGDGTPPELAHRIAVELAEKAFGKYECVVATHIDREHIHSHIVFNSVSFEDGKKYHSNGNTVQALMDLSDEICMKYGVSVLDRQPQKKKDVLSDREYRSAVRGESWKFQLMNAVTEVMKQAKSRKQFVFMMKQLGYNVRWEESRKYITYTCPSGRRCRCAKLHGEKFSKEMMEYEFEIRRERLDGTQQIRPTGGRGNHAYGGGGQPKLDGSDQSAEKILRDSEGTVGVAWRADDQTGFGKSGESTDQNPTRNAEKSGAASGRNDPDVAIIHAGITVTGWETERRILLQAERIRRTQYETQSQADWDSYSDTISTADIVDSVASVASIIDNAPTDPEELERYIEAQRAAQNAGLLIGAAVAAIELLSERLEEMKADAEEIDMDIS
ncbi:MAG: relaxase/mobilization nuclease domain-containing protein [Oscillospiraceae bacterium]|nr:relaxase/mobilization nuclease domain-containing protein [Oscillospiraceae bacterium]